MSSYHDSVELRLPPSLYASGGLYGELRGDDYFVQIDRKLAEVIMHCWRLGLRTTFCCEDEEDGRAYICFASEAERDVMTARCSVFGVDISAWAIEEHNGAGIVRFPTAAILRVECALKESGAQQ